MGSIVPLLNMLLAVICLIAGPVGQAQNAPAAPPSSKSQKLLTQPEIDALQVRINDAKSIKQLREVDETIARHYRESALPSAMARRLGEQVIGMETRLGAAGTLDMAHTASNIAGYMPAGQENVAARYYLRAFTIAMHKLPPEDPWHQELKSDIVRCLVFARGSREQIEHYSPDCPKCHSVSAVVPIYGFIPMRPADYGHSFVLSMGGHAGGPKWYCRKCRGAFWPYGKGDFVIDEASASKAKSVPPKAVKKPGK